MSTVDARSMDRPLTVAMVALGGQGGGVLTKWLVDVAEANDFLVQSTYIAGVAQRTGATVYCVEMFPKDRAEALGKTPVFALYPVPGDVDVVVASELAEAGRAVQKGFVTANATTVIASTHRVYSVDEKSALGDGLLKSGPIIDGVRQSAKRFIGFDMSQAADASGSVISAVILGAIAGSGALPFARTAYTAAIERSGRAVAANLAGFAAGFDKVGAEPTEGATGEPMAAPVAGPNGQALAERIERDLAPPVHDLALHGALRALDYQDRAYAEQYIDTLVALQQRDLAAGGEPQQLALTVTAAPRLALQMCYEDTIRVADLKTRGERFEQIRRDLNAAADQPAYVVEYFHPRYEEFCDTLPAGLGRRLLGSMTMRRLTRPLFGSGRNVNTTKITGYLMLSTMARLRRWRRGTYRYQLQQQHVGAWLERINSALANDYASAVEIARCIEIVRGYGDTYERGLSRYEQIVSASDGVDPAQRAGLIQRLREAALADEQGQAFTEALKEVGR